MIFNLTHKVLNKKRMIKFKNIYDGSCSQLSTYYRLVDVIILLQPSTVSAMTSLSVVYLSFIICDYQNVFIRNVKINYDCPILQGRICSLF